jgi:hypothetical protein
MPIFLIDIKQQQMYRVITNDCLIAVGVKNSHKFWICLPTLDQLVDRFPLPPGAPPIGILVSLMFMRLAAHSTTSPTPTAMGQSFIMTLYKYETVTMNNL